MSWHSMGARQDEEGEEAPATTGWSHQSCALFALGVMDDTRLFMKLLSGGRATCEPFGRFARGDRNV